MTSALDKLIALLDLEETGTDLFRGHSISIGSKRVFGGQVIGQALVAAMRTVADLDPHSLHCYFLRPGNPDKPIIFEVERIRDGRSFVTRRVVASQEEHAIFSLSCSFHKVEPGPTHQMQMKDVPLPQDLLSVHEVFEKYKAHIPEHMARFWATERPFEMRFVDPSHYITRDKTEPEQAVWFRTSGKVGNDALHQALFAYASDYNLVGSALIPHGKTFFDSDMMVASLDHAIWFHRSFRADEWLLYQMDSPVAFGARGFCRGSVFDQDGMLVASTVQEGLIRPLT